MIFFITCERHGNSLDIATRGNTFLFKALKVSSRKNKILIEKNAKRENLLTALSQGNDTLFIMSHGSEVCLPPFTGQK